MSLYREHAPAPHVGDRVECFWISQFAKAVPHRVLPDGCADIIYTQANGVSRLQFIGPMTRFEDFPQSACSISVGVRFRPGMWDDVLRGEGASCADCILPLDALWGRRAAELSRRLDSAVSVSRQIELLTHSLPPSGKLSPVQQVVRALERAHGILSLDDLATAANLSTRQFRRRCLAATALTPKQLGRILRFRNAHTHLLTGTSLADLALECGYFDQSHLAADFLRFSGQSPARFRL